MPQPKPLTQRRIKEVANLRVNGMPWAQIAKRFQYDSANSACAQLTSRYPDLWREAYERERELWLDELEQLAADTQRDLIHSAEDKVRQMAAHSLLAHAAKLRAQKIRIEGGDMQPQEINVKLDLGKDPGGAAPKPKSD